MRLCTPALLLAFPLLLSPGVAAAQASELSSEEPSSELSVPVTRGTKVVMAPRYEEELVMESEVIHRGQSAELTGAIAAGEPTIVYMNRVGGTFSPGNNDARTNLSTLMPGTVSIPPAPMSNEDWSEVMSCVTDQFSRWNVQVTDTDPGNVPHIESVVAGSPVQLGMPQNVGGVSPFTSNCDFIPNSIVFTFAGSLNLPPQRICEIAAQEIAHSFGLDHEYLCEDPMTYLNGCGDKSFQPVAAPCGEGAPRECAVPGQYNCGYAEQNSVALLDARLGLNDGVAPSELSFLTPGDGQKVGAGFDISVGVSGAERVELRIDGVASASSESAPFSFTAPTDLALGTHVLEVVAFQGVAQSRRSISVELVDGDGDPGTGEGAATDGEGGTQPFVTGGCRVGASGAGSLGLWSLLIILAMLYRRLPLNLRKRSSSG